MDIKRNKQRKAIYPNAHQEDKYYPITNDLQSSDNKADGFQSSGYIFPLEIFFDYSRLNQLFSQLKVERIKGILNTNRGWFIINGVEGSINLISSVTSVKSRIEIIARQNQVQDISVELDKCKVD